MAKKRRKEEDEEFQLPEFNESDFLRKEITSAKMILLVVLLAIVAAIISYFLTLAGIVVVAFFAGLAVVLLLKYVPKAFGIDTSKLERKDWFGYGSTYFFAWLAIWVLVMNVPFSDVTPPGLYVYVDGVSATPDVPVTIHGKNWAFVTAKATDNAGINVVLIQTTVAPNQTPMTMDGGSGLWGFNITGFISGTLGVTVIAEDVNGHTSSVTIILTRS
jgi:hypothetical protein